MNIYIETLPEATRKVLDKINIISDLQNFYLSGGTALALQLGHRESEDLDFFNQQPFSPETLQQKLLSIGKLDNVEISEGTLNIFLENVKLQFLYYPYELLMNPRPWKGIFLSAVIDIACTKLITVSARGSKKDFIDIYFILKQFPLPELFKKLAEKYSNIDYNHAHIMKSLVYFEDADKQPMPRMHIPVEWDEVKDSITKAVKNIQF